MNCVIQATKRNHKFRDYESDGEHHLSKEKTDRNEKYIKRSNHLEEKRGINELESPSLQFSLALVRMQSTKEPDHWIQLFTRIQEHWERALSGQIEHF